MTKPDEFYHNVIQAMEYLDTILPKGSHVFLTGLANGLKIFIFEMNRLKIKFADIVFYYY